MKDRDSAFHHFPVILFDRIEPFLPSRVGYIVFDGPSDSRVDWKRKLGKNQAISFDLENLESVIEYGIWWDWDIEHLYELEAVWVYIDGKGDYLRVEASWHGDYNKMEICGRTPMRDGRPLLYSQPGKHALAPSPSWFNRKDTITSCSKNAGSGGVHVTSLFEGRIGKTTEFDRLASEYLKSKAFIPSFNFSKEWRMPREAFVPWEELEVWIPRRVREVLRRLKGGVSS